MSYLPYPGALAALSERIQAAGAQRQTLQICGGNTKAFYGDASNDEAGQGRLSTADLPLVCDHQPTELVVTVSGNWPLAQLQADLAAKGQYLPFDPPHFGAGATVGGMVAAGLSGPARSTVGPVRDYVLGLHLLDGKGQSLHFGGQVMKNVAGYDVSRLLAGSMGQLGVITQVSLKVLPIPVADLTLQTECTQAIALTWLNQWGAMALPLHASCWLPPEPAGDPASTLADQPAPGILRVRLRGATAAVQSAKQKLQEKGAQPLDADVALVFWNNLREQTLPFFSLAQGEALWRLSLPDTCHGIDEPLLATGLGSAQGTTPPMLVEWGGAQRWIKAPLQAGGALQGIAVAAGGHATRFRLGVGITTNESAFTPLQGPLARLHRQLLLQLDPLGVFNTGRMGARA